MIERTLSLPIGPEGGAKRLHSEPLAALHGLEVRGETTPDDAPVAILLHGGPGASHDYLRPQLDRLGGDRHRRLVYYDQRGSGLSTIPNDWEPAGIDMHVADLHMVVATVADEKPALIGYSWGGLLALRFALDAPETISRLLLIAPAPSHWGAREVMKARLAAAAQRPDVRAFTESIDRDDRRQRFAASVAGYFVDPHRALELSPFIVRQRAEQAVWASLKGYDLRPRLPTLDVPCLILHGVEDPIPIESARETSSLSGASLIELPHCGHVPYIEGGSQFFSAALGFLR
jgi:pimeloyl-ACP methyl ester carboxylesterase